MYEQGSFSSLGKKSGVPDTVTLEVHEICLLTDQVVDCRTPSRCCRHHPEKHFQWMDLFVFFGGIGRMGCPLLGRNRLDLVASNVEPAINVRIIRLDCRKHMRQW